MSTSSPEFGTGSYSIGPPLPAELLKPPFTPKAAGRIAFFFGPFAGALVSVISLRRMGRPEQASKALSVALFGSLGLAIVLFFIPESFARLVGLGAEFVFYHIFKDLQKDEFAEWQAANASIQPSSGWLAVGWGFLGLLLFLIAFFVVFVVLGFFGLKPR
jgi:hypothetical protein